MNRQFLWAGLALLAAFLLWSYRETGVSPSATPDSDANVALAVDGLPPAEDETSPANNVDENDDSPNEGPTDTEKASLKEMTSILMEFTQNPRSLEDLVRHLQSAGQDPFVARDENSATGEMSVVRTKSPLPGTRYFHAQYFKNESGQRVAQHMSFEYRPGPNAMSDAIQAVTTALPNLGKPGRQTNDFVSWETKTCTLWIKRMSLEDLRDDPINAYTDDDAGTIRIACEENPHPQGDETHGHR